MNNLVKTSTNPRHLSKTVEHMTPEYIINSVRNVMGKIDFDPFSNELANKYIGAIHYCSLENGLNGWKEPWRFCTFVNPPGGKINGKSSQVLAWQRLIDFYDKGDVTEAIFMCFSLEFFQTVQTNQIGKLPMEFAFCIPKKRIKYLKPDGTSSANPTHSSAIVLVNNKHNKVKQIAKFKEEFSSIGCVVIPQ